MTTDKTDQLLTSIVHRLDRLVEMEKSAALERQISSARLLVIMGLLGWKMDIPAPAPINLTRFAK